MPTLSTTIGGVVRDILPGWRIREVLNGRNLFDGALECGAVGDVPTSGQTITESEDGITIYAGDLEASPVVGHGGSGPGAGVVAQLKANDYNARAQHRVIINGGFPDGTLLKTAILSLAGWLVDDGITVDPAQANGPALPAMSFDVKDVAGWLDALTIATGWPWDISYTGVLSMKQPGTVPAPFAISDTGAGDDQLIGDITVEPASEADYANRIIVLAGTGTRDVTSERHYGNGAARRFALDATVVTLIGALWVNGATSFPVGVYGVDDMPWTFDAATNELVQRVDQAVLGLTDYLEQSYTGAFPMRVQSPLASAEPTAEQTAYGRVVERVVTLTDVFTKNMAQAMADGYLTRATAKPRRVRYTTDETGLHPGQAQSIQSTRRGIAVAKVFTIEEVEIEHVGGDCVLRHVTAVEGLVLPENWRDVAQQWFTGSGSGGSAVGSSIVSGGGSVTLASPVNLGGTDVADFDAPAWARIKNSLRYHAAASGSVRFRIELWARDATVGVKGRLYDESAAAGLAPTSEVTSTVRQEVEVIVTVTEGHRYVAQAMATTVPVGKTSRVYANGAQVEAA